MALCACGCGQETPIAKRTRRSRGYVAGQPQKYILGHDRHTGKTTTRRNGYTYRGGVPLHREIVEKIIGRPLPQHAIVHHINGDRSDNRPQNLVVCDSPAHHALIHARERAIRECGHASWRMCSICKQWDAPANLSGPTKNRRSVRHKECHRLYELKRRQAQNNKSA